MRFLCTTFLGMAAVGLSTVAAAEAPAVDAAALFKRSCAMCHGPDGRATAPASQKMGVKDLSHTELADEQILAAIVNGVKGAKGAMPAYGAKFSAPELNALVAHIRSLRDSETPAKP